MVQVTLVLACTGYDRNAKSIYLHRRLLHYQYMYMYYVQEIRDCWNGGGSRFWSSSGSGFHVSYVRYVFFTRFFFFCLVSWLWTTDAAYQVHGDQGSQVGCLWMESGQLVDLGRSQRKANLLPAPCGWEQGGYYPGGIRERVGAGWKGQKVTPPKKFPRGFSPQNDS